MLTQEIFALCSLIYPLFSLTENKISLRMRKPTIWIYKTGPTQTELHKLRRWLETGKVEELCVYHPCSENKGTDQLHSY